ncbi:hypothetical protein BIW11_03089 [Tropilaelaps mercedesae]|uniref:Uncharacterized protein n=1 Tax=Tropilaelaps mercedesae TaxID=418985 RepID=A0A1V9XS98_9ACAR|nr:hypothetical protein BIW11_03089 [Tropilaelaps mercedesae]
MTGIVLLCNLVARKWNYIKSMKSSVCALLELCGKCED